MNVVFLIGRILFASAFLYSGKGLLEGGASTRRAVGSDLAVKAIALGSVVGALLIAFGVLADAGAMLVGAGLLIVTPLKHNFWGGTRTGREDRKAAFMRNVTLLGAAVIIFWVYNQLQGGAPLSLTDPLFNSW